MPMNKTTRVMAVKMLKEKHLESFLNGNVFMNPAAYFKTLESGDVVRADSHEGAHWARQIKELAVQDENGGWIPIAGIINPLVYFTENSANFNMFCMYMFTDQPDDPFDERNLDFGERFAMIINLPEFLRRLRVAAEMLGQECSYAPVEYVAQETHDGYMGPFRKFDSFSYQHEYRIVLPGGNGKPLALQIGDIRDITYCGPITKLGEVIEQLKDNAAKERDAALPS
jgi:hypothetical protein